MVVRTISPNDGMCEDRTWYFRIGRSGLDCIRLALSRAEREPPESILDFGCGYGRVLRFLKAEFPAASLTACELNADAAQFCAQTFGATPVVSDPDPSKVELPRPFDLIWCGSVFTHLPLEKWQGFLRLLRDALSPDGLLVFTTSSGTDALPDEIKADLRAQCERGGFGFVDYGDGYGYSVSSPDVVQSQVTQAGLATVFSKVRAWNDHQDVTACETRQSA